MKTDFAIATTGFRWHVIKLATISAQWKVGDDFGKEDPGAPTFGEDVGIFAVPAEAGPLRYGAIYHAPGIDEEAGLHVADFAGCIFA